MHVRPERVLADLRELAELTGGPDGARRVAWTEEWGRARGWLRQRIEALDLAMVPDPAGNCWTLLPGESERMVVLGSHVDSVPAGGPLDGALGVLAGLEVLRALVAGGGRPPVSVALVDWADEEGARFGRSLLGSSAAAGTLDPDAVRELRDGDGVRLEDALRAFDVDLDRAPSAAERLPRIAAVLELHIEQGPVLERLGRPLAAVTGCLGVERHRLLLRGRPAHAGSTPMEDRRDPLVAAARVIAAVDVLAREHGGRGTVGRLRALPGTPTAVNAEVELTVDLRHESLDGLNALLDGTLAAARTPGIELEVSPVWRIDPIAFHPELVELAARATGDAEPLRLVSGALHDTAELVRAGVPGTMLFVPSLGGISHAADERTPDADVAEGVRAFARLAESTIAWASHA